ncbi:MAG: hypothetical protein GY830_11315 [Bacteroidetes bacterium]|nr:hypothetical protein [Bacteroidota bacterium]
MKLKKNRAKFLFLFTSYLWCIFLFVRYLNDINDFSKYKSKFNSKYFYFEKNKKK